MIDQFNRQQIIHGCLRALLALAIYCASYYFFRFLLIHFMEDLYQDRPPLVRTVLPALPIAYIIYKGVQRWQWGLGHYTISESSIPHLPESRGLMSSVYNSDRRGDAAWNYLMKAFFLAGPIQMMKAYDHFNGRVPNEHGLEAKLHTLLKTLQQINKWQDFNAHPGHERELIFLINMGKVDYSANKGKIKANV